MSKAGQADIRRLLIIGAISRLNWLEQGRAGGIVVGAYAGSHAQDAGGDSTGKQDGASDLGDAYEGRRFQGSGPGAGWHDAFASPGRFSSGISAAWRPR